MISILKTKTMIEMLEAFRITEFYMVSDFIQLNLNQQQLMYRINANMEIKARYEGSEEYENLTRYLPC